MKKAVLVSGCSGKMGQMICSAVNASDDMFVLYGFDESGVCPNGFDFEVFRQVRDIKEGTDVIIDFSSPEGTHEIVTYAYTRLIPIAIGTTGLEKEREALQKVSTEIPVFQCYNMSSTINLLGDSVKNLVKKLPPSTDIEISETHHAGKKDSPSGTAYMLADIINDALGGNMNVVYGRAGLRENNEIGISSIRGGNTPGEHTIYLFGKHETIEIKHTAYSREIFAEGAVEAARFLLQKPAGFYTMKDLIQSYD